MRQYDPNPGLSAFAVALGAVLGIGLGVALGFGGFGLLVTAIIGILAAGLIASALGIVGERRPERSDGDLPSHYDDY